MDKIEFIANGTVTSPQGFSAGATSADIRHKGDNRLGFSYTQFSGNLHCCGTIHGK